MTSLAPPICAGCTHRIGDLREPKCAAFSSGIPREVVLSRVDHRLPYPGDQGIRFDPVDPYHAALAAFMFASTEEESDAARELARAARVHPEDGTARP